MAPPSLHFLELGKPSYAFENNARPNSVSKSNTSSKLTRLAKLWITFGKSLVLHGIIINDEVISEEPARTLALGSAWQNIFQAKAFDPVLASGFLTELGNFGEYSDNIHAPGYFNFYYSMQHRPNSFPGPDRVPFAGWVATGDLGINCMQNIDKLFRNGSLPPAGDDFNHSDTAFLVKGEKLTDEVAVNRDAMEMRPLSMKNTFNKLIMAANSRAFGQARNLGRLVRS